MSDSVNNYGSDRRWRSAAPLIMTCLLPLTVMGVAVKPALDASGVSERLDSARERSAYARGLQGFFASFGEDGPPTESYEQIEALLLARLPETVEVTALFRAVLFASDGLAMSLAAVVPGNEEDLGYPAGQLTVHERRVVLKGQARVQGLTAFLAALHREGYPVCVHNCTLNALAEQQGLFDFQIELGAFYLSPPSVTDDESEPPL